MLFEEMQVAHGEGSFLNVSPDPMLSFRFALLDLLAMYPCHLSVTKWLRHTTKVDAGIPDNTYIRLNHHNADTLK